MTGMPEAGENLRTPVWRRLYGAARSFVAPATLSLFIAGLAFLGAFEPADNALMDARFRLIDRAPSDTLVVVEIDPQSIRDEGRWPWPRDRYARVVENLQDAGAALIAFDVDFSSASDFNGDAAFAAALARRPGEVVLPVFWQWSTRSGKTRELIKTPPNEKFLTDAVVASVTLTAEKNGVLRRGWRAVADGESHRTTLSGVLAGVPADRRDTFYIDFSIDLDRIERLSFRDVLHGEFPPEAVRGKNIMIGATALELGDEFAAPVLGVTPGVMLHALSYESLAQNRTLTRTHPAIALALAALMLIWLCRNTAEKSAPALALTHATLLALLLAVPVAVQTVFPVSIDTGALLAAQGFSLLYAAGARLRHRAQQIIRHRAATVRFQELTSIVVRDNSDGVIVTDDAGVVELCNDRAKELLHVGGEMSRGAVLAELISDFPVLASGALDAQETVHCEYIAASSGAALEIIASRRLIPTGGVRGREKQTASDLLVYTIRDVSARKRVEQAEREAKEAAIAANTMKTQLISNMSHELRTPLNGVIGFAGIMKNESFGAHTVPEYKEYSANIHDSGARLLALVNNMLNISKLDAGDFEIAMDRARIDEVMETAASRFEAEAEKKGARIKIEVQDGMPDVDIDVSVFNEMLSHLLDNALKFTGEGARIVLRATHAGPEFMLEVEDNGCGAAPELLPRLTEAFFQGDGALNRAHEGAGLGLYIVSKFAALQGGAIEFESEPGKGFAARLRFSDIFSKTTPRGETESPALDDAAAGVRNIQAAG